VSVDTMLVAPVALGDGAYTGAGSVITDDVPSGALGIARGRQRNVEGYAERRRRRAERSQPPAAEQGQPASAEPRDRS